MRHGTGIGVEVLGKLGWTGLILAAIGWALLIAKVVGLGVAPAALRNDAGEVARALIESGFALAAISCLRNGFGALNRFFDTVLARSGAREARDARPRPAAVVPDDADGPIHDARPWRTLPDGSVEVETILGTRRFDTMAQARDFI